MDHLREALTDPCPEGSIMPLTMCHARLVGLESASYSLLLSNVTTAYRKRNQTSQSEKKTKKTNYFDFARKVDQLSSALELLLPLLAKVQPKTDIREKVQPELCMKSSPMMHKGQNLDVMSVAATDSLFETIADVTSGAEENLPADPSQHSGSETMSEKSGGSSSVVASLEGTLKAMLARINLDPPQPAVGSENICYLLRRAQRTSITMPQCNGFTSELLSALQNSTKATRPDHLAHTLAVMQDPGTIGLGSMPPIESSVAALIVSPDEVLR